MTRPYHRHDSDAPTKRCPKCEQYKDRATGFYKLKRSPDGLATYCRECQLAAYHKDRDRQTANMRARYVRNREAERARNRRYLEEHAAERAAYKREYRRANREKIAAAKREWDQANRARTYAHRDKRNALKKGASRGEVVERPEVLARGARVCGICAEPVDPSDFHVDHIVPLSHGGEHSYENTQPAHPFCNLSKHNRLPEEVAA